MKGWELLEASSLILLAVLAVRRRKVIDLADYITASEAAAILSIKLGRRVDPSYMHKLRHVRTIRINRTTSLYHRGDIVNTKIRQRGGNVDE